MSCRRERWGKWLVGLAIIGLAVLGISLWFSSLPDKPVRDDYATQEAFDKAMHEYYRDCPAFLMEEPVRDDYETSEAYEEAVLEYYHEMNQRGIGIDKPVIYLYPEEEMQVSVRLDFDGDLTCTYPTYIDGWNVMAQPDGTLTNLADGREYSYLYWEGISQIQWDLSEGFVVKGEDTAAFLQDTLARIGLTPTEYNEFIVYWLPKMQDNPYNLITFQQEVYTDAAKLEITPVPDRVLRVFMAYQALEEPVAVQEPEIAPFTREGFTVVEWGGTEVVK